MNAADILILALLALACAGILRGQKKRGRQSCCGGCASFPYGAACKEKKA